MQLPTLVPVRVAPKAPWHTRKFSRGLWRWHVPGLIGGILATSGVFEAAAAEATNFSPAPSPRPDAWVADGPVHVMLEHNGAIYLGGSFDSLRPPRGTGVALDVVSLQPRMDFPQVTGTILAVASDQAGGFYLGGAFTQVGGLPRTNLAYVRPDRQVGSWAPAINGTVSALAWANGVVYAGGDFSTLNGQSRARLAAIDGATGAVTAWNPGASDRVTEIVVAQNSVYVAGPFVAISGQARAGVAAIDSEGLLLPWNPAPLGSVRALAVAGDVVYAGGTFTNIDGQPRDRLAALDAHTGHVTPWIVATDSSVLSVDALAISGNRLYVGGNFTRLGGAQRKSLAALDAGTGAATLWDPNPSGPTNLIVNALAATENMVLVGGNFDAITGQPRPGFAALHATTGLVLPWTLQFMGAARRFAISFRTAFVAGPTLTTGAVVRHNAAALDAVTGQPTAWNPDVVGSVWALLGDGGGLYVGGSYIALGGQSFFNLALVDATNGNHIPTFNHEVGGPVYALARAADGRILVGGGFVAIDSLDRPFLASFLPSGALTSWSPQPDGPVYALAAAGNTAYAAGDFRNIGGGQRQFLAALDIGQGLVPNWNPSPDAAVISLLVTGNTLYVAGNFSNIGGQFRRGVAALNVTNGLATAWNASVDGGVGGLGVAQGTLFLGGSFTTVRNVARRNLAAVSTANGSVLAWDPSPDSIVHRLLTAQNGVLTGGEFGVAGYALADAPRLLTPPAHQAVPAGSAVTFRALAQGTPAPSYQWRFNGNTLPGATSSNLTLASVQAPAAGAYSVSVSNSAGHVVSPDAILSVLTPPAILNHPASTTVVPGANVTLSVDAVGSPRYYAWSLNGNPLPGAIGPALSLPNVQVNHGGAYRVSVFNDIGAAESLLASVAVSAPAFTFANHLANRLSLPQTAAGARSGNNFNADLEPLEPTHGGLPGGHSVWCEWAAPQSGVVTFGTQGSDFDTVLAVYAAGGNLGSLSLLVEDDDDGGFGTSKVVFPVEANKGYWIAIDGVGGAMGRITLNWNLVAGAAIVPRILAQPRSTSVPRGSNVTLSVTATNLGSANLGPLAYQWRRGERSIPGATNATLTLTDVRERDLGGYVATVGGFAALWEITAVAELGLGELPGFRRHPKPHVATPIRLSEIIRPLSFTPAHAGSYTPTTGVSRVSTAAVGGTPPAEPLPADCYDTIYLCSRRVACPKPFVVTNDLPEAVAVFVEGSGMENVVGVFTGPPADVLQNPVPDSCDTSRPSAAGVPDHETRIMFMAEPGRNYGIVATSLNDQPGLLSVRITVCPRPVALPPADRFVRFEGSRALLNVLPGLDACGWSYQWLSNGMIINGARSQTLERSYPLQPASYSVVLSNCAGLTTTSVVEFVQLQFEPVFRTLIAPGSFWRYYDAGGSPGNAWPGVTFTDSIWSEGRAPLGYGDANGLLPQTNVRYGSDPTRRHITTYFRQRFVVASPAAYADPLRLSLQCDDGAIVYLNGSEVFRVNLPVGAINPGSLATDPFEGPDETQWRTINVSSSLLAITNVLAIELHQHTPSSDDLWLDLEFTGRPAPSRAPFPFDETARHWYYLSRTPPGSNPINVQFAPVQQRFPPDWGNFECSLPTTIFETPGATPRILFQAWPD